jgi:archaellum component FlaC
LELQCKNIVNEISDKFIDLGLDEGNHSGYGAGMMEKQDKFNKEFDKFKFQFDNLNNQIPSGKVDNEQLLGSMDKSLKRMNEEVGNDLTDIYNIIFQQSRSGFAAEGPIIEYN